jgi:hypothetical protein
MGIWGRDFIETDGDMRWGNTTSPSNTSQANTQMLTSDSHYLISRERFGCWTRN